MEIGRAQRSLPPLYSPVRLPAGGHALLVGACPRDEAEVARSRFESFLDRPSPFETLGLPHGAEILGEESRKIAKEARESEQCLSQMALAKMATQAGGRANSNPDTVAAPPRDSPPRRSPILPSHARA